MSERISESRGGPFRWIVITVFGLSLSALVLAWFLVPRLAPLWTARSSPFASQRLMAARFGLVVSNEALADEIAHCRRETPQAMRSVWLDERDFASAWCGLAPITEDNLPGWERTLADPDPARRWLAVMASSHTDGAPAECVPEPLEERLTRETDPEVRAALMCHYDPFWVDTEYLDSSVPILAQALPDEDRPLPTTVRDRLRAELGPVAMARMADGALHDIPAGVAAVEALRSIGSPTAALTLRRYADHCTATNPGFARRCRAVADSITATLAP